MNIIELVNVQKLLETERAKHMMSYEDVAEELGCSASYVFRIEKGKRKKPSYGIVSKMINLFQLSDMDLVKYVDDKDKENLHIPESHLVEKDIINFIKNMDTEKISEVNQLLLKVSEYQNLLKTENSIEEVKTGDI